eukprot:3815068-Karenia_brevis.AAC.1
MSPLSCPKYSPRIVMLLYLEASSLLNGMPSFFGFLLPVLGVVTLLPPFEAHLPNHKFSVPWICIILNTPVFFVVS